MGLLSDLQMGLGLKDRDKKYYERTAKSIENQRGKAAAQKYRDRTGLTSGAKVGSKNMPVRGGLMSGSFGQYRDINDMFDGGGPMARGGQYEGGGLLSFLGNLFNAAVGRDMGKSVAYGAPMQVTKKPMPRQTPVTGYYPDMAMMSIEGMGEPTTNPFAVGGGMDNILNDAFPIAEAPSAYNSAKTTAQQDSLLELARDMVAAETKDNFTMPAEEKRAREIEKYTELMITLGIE